MPSTKAFLNPSSLEFIFPTKGYVPVISPVPRLPTPLACEQALWGALSGHRELARRPAPLPTPLLCYSTAKGTSPIPLPFSLPPYPYPFRHLLRRLEEENTLAWVQMPPSLQKKSGERRLWGEGASVHRLRTYDGRKPESFPGEYSLYKW